jgi:hypothetical protein
VRWSLLLLLVAISRLALAEPKVAVAPLDDDDGKIADIVADAANARAKVLGRKRVESAMRSLGVSVLSSKTLKKLRKKLDADVVIYGSVEREGGDRRVSLTFAGKNKKKSKLEVDFKSTKQLRKELAAKLPRRIAEAMEGSGGDDDDDEEDEDDLRAKREEQRRRDEEDRRKREEEDRRREDEAKRERQRREDEDRKREEERKRRDDDERRAKRDRDEGKRRDDDERKRRDDDERKRRDDDDRRAKRDRDDDRKRRGDDDDRRARRDRDDDDRKRRRDDDDDDRRARRDRRDDADEDADRRARRDRDDEDEDGRDRKRKRREQRHVLAQAALWLDAGGAVARRTLTYEATGMNIPPPVGTAAAAGRIEGEVYPAAFSTLKGPAAGFGINAVYSRTFGLGIAVPGTTVTAPIKNGHYAIGARYRFVFGQHSLALGVSYWRRYYMADRSGLMNPEDLDMPDVDYSAIAPGGTLRIAATPKIAAFASLDLPLMLHSGPIQDPTSYGAAKILAFDLRGGAQIMVAEHAALQIGLEVDQVGLSFTGQPGSMAVRRAVKKATDRSVGLAATIGLTY